MELDGALGSLEGCLIFRLGPSFNTFTITTNTVDTHPLINMYISQRQPAILDVRERLAIKVHTLLDNILRCTSKTVTNGLRQTSKRSDYTQRTLLSSLLLSLSLLSPPPCLYALRAQPHEADLTADPAASLASPFLYPIPPPLRFPAGRFDTNYTAFLP